MKDGLTSREHAVLAELVTGASNKEIARRLDISPFTVREYVQRLGVKLGCRNRVDIVVHWLRSKDASLHLSGGADGQTGASLQPALSAATHDGETSAPAEMGSDGQSSIPLGHDGEQTASNARVVVAGWERIWTKRR